MRASKKIWLVRTLTIMMILMAVGLLGQCRHYDPLVGWSGLVGAARDLKPIRRIGGPKAIEEWAYSRTNLWEVESACKVLGFISAHSILPRSKGAYSAYIRIYEKLANGWIEELTLTCNGRYRHDGTAEYSRFDEKMHGNHAAFWEYMMIRIATIQHLIEEEDWRGLPRYDMGRRHIEDAFGKFRARNWPRRQVGIGWLETHLSPTPPSETPE